LRIYHDKSFKDITTFKIGGAIENLYYPEDIEDVQVLMEQLTGKQFHVIGAGSKILADQGPFQNVICITMLNGLTFKNTELEAMAGTSAPYTSRECARRGFSGLEFLIDIPATLGGAVYMNAGFMGNEMSQICESVSMVDSKGKEVEFEDIKWARRWSSIQNIDGIVTKIRLKLIPSTKIEIKKRIKHYHGIRLNRQPRGLPSAGGIFINHERLNEVIEKLPYLRRGGAEIVASSPNFIVNHGFASFEDVIHLVKLVKKYAYEKLGITLREEIRVLVS